MKLYEKLKIFLLIIIAFAAPLFSCSEGEPRCAHTDLSSEMLSPTCDRTGGTRSVCADCGETFMTELTLPIGHKYEVTTVPPSCDEPGYDIYSCSACGIEYKSNHTSPLGHTLSITATPPTCNTEGYKTAECQVCEYTLHTTQSRQRGTYSAKALKTFPPKIKSAARPTPAIADFHTLAITDFTRIFFTERTLTAQKFSPKALTFPITITILPRTAAVYRLIGRPYANQATNLPFYAQGTGTGRT